MECGPFMLVLVILEGKEHDCFEDGVLSLQELKAFFLFLLWLESKLFIKDGPRR